LSLLWLLSVSSKPHAAVLGNVKGRKGFHDIADYPEARTTPGLLLYRFDANLVFYNADYFVTQLRAAIAAQSTPVEWVVIDASSINVIDVSALNTLQALRSELEAEGISFYHARIKRHLERHFNAGFAQQQRDDSKGSRFQTLKPAVRAYLKHQRAQGKLAPDTDVLAEFGEDSERTTKTP
jgi:MFS superfamily sulfate permease-like transporter